jgi:hypothetical protein
VKSNDNRKGIDGQNPARSIQRRRHRHPHQVGGLIYIFVILRAIESSRLTEARIFAGALPIRLVAWSLALALFYGFRDRPKIVVLAPVAGVIWSYILDGLMAILYQLPGMTMPFC